MNLSAHQEPVRVTVEGATPEVTALKELLGDFVATSFPSGFSLAVLDAEGPVFSAYGGQACRIGTPCPVTADTSYDLASLTKVVCSVTLTLVFAARDMLSLEDRVERWLPHFPRSDTTLTHLLTHTSGLIAHKPFFESLRGRSAIEAAVFDEARGSPPTGEVLYSDLNFMLLGWALEACGGAPLDVLFAREVAGPLAMSRTVFRPGRREETAATELDGDQRLTQGLVWGEVHDGNAHALGDVAGHAGLFGPLDDLVTFTRHLLVPDGSVLTPAGLDAMTARRAATGDDVRGLGWRLAPKDWGSWPEATLWHTGFTGTSLLVSGPLGLGVVLLTNAIHPVRRIGEQAEMRAVIHRCVSEAFA
ncbi:MAG: serine hydrolase domain-containing protein [Acidimicrobiales bacterium]|jgi:CubicO group peptidase (beta-lactamase class C family)